MNEDQFSYNTVTAEDSIINFYILHYINSVHIISLHQSYLHTQNIVLNHTNGNVINEDL